MKIEMTPNNFYLTALKYKDRLNPFAVTCQTYLETGNYRSVLSVNANNFAGIKKTKQWTGKTYSIDSPEYINGSKYIRRSEFRAYDNLDDFLIDYIEKIKQARYSDVRYYGISNYICYFYGLYSGGWATDPKYPEKLIDISFKLGPELIDENWIVKAKKVWDDAQSKYPRFSNEFKNFMDSKFKKVSFPSPVQPHTKTVANKKNKNETFTDQLEEPEKDIPIVEIEESDNAE